MRGLFFIACLFVVPSFAFAEPKVISCGRSVVGSKVEKVELVVNLQRKAVMTLFLGGLVEWEKRSTRIRKIGRGLDVSIEFYEGPGGPVGVSYRIQLVSEHKVFGAEVWDIDGPAKQKSHRLLCLAK